MTRAYLTGRRQIEEKNVIGENQYTLKIGGATVAPPQKTAEKVSKQAGISSRII